MSLGENKNFEKKTTTLGINDLTEDVTVLMIAQAFQNVASSIRDIKISVRRNIRNAFVDFFTVTDCENALQNNSEIKIGTQTFSLHYAKSQSSSPFNMVASENKLYVKYPQAADENEIIKMLGDVHVTKPENSKNYFFATCKDIDEQCTLVKNLNKKQVNGGELVVKVAIDRTRKPKPSARKTFATAN